MHHGTVLFYNRLKGFGFIIPAPNGDDLFFYYSQIVMPGVKRLDSGQRVTYEIGPNPRKGGLMALSVTPVTGGRDEHRQ